MKHIQGFNEKFNFSKLNIFSSKKKEELKKKEKVNEDDEALAEAIYSEISSKVKGNEITGNLNSTGLTFIYRVDKFTVYTNGFLVNNQELECSKETVNKFKELFNSKKESFKKEQEDSKKKEIKDKLKAKFIKK